MTSFFDVVGVAQLSFVLLGVGLTSAQAAQHKVVAIKFPITTDDSSPQTLAARAQSLFSSPPLILVVS